MYAHADLPEHCRRILLIAERDPRRGVVYSRRCHQQASDGEVAERAWTAYTCGVAYTAWERFDAVDGYLDEAVALFRAIEHRGGLLRCRRALLTLDHLRGADASLQDRWRALAAEHEAAGDMPGAARVRLDQAAHLNVLARAQEALELVAQITPQITASGTSAELARLTRLAAIASTSAGHFSAASELIERAILQYRAQRLRIDVAKCLHERAWLALRLERLAEAQADLEGALVVFQRYDLPLNIAFCEKSVGLVASRRGRFSPALAATLQARERFTTLDRFDFIARCDLHLGIIAAYSGLFELAIVCYQRAATTFDTLGAVSFAHLAQRNQALALCAHGLPAEALDLLAELERYAQGSDSLELAEILLEQAKAQRNLGRMAMAVSVFERAERIFTSVGNAAASAECRLERGWLYLDDGDLARAEIALHTAGDELADRPSHRWRLEYGRARCAELRGATDTALGYYRQASATIATLRSSLVNEHASSGLFAQAEALFTDALRLTASIDEPLVVLELIEQQRAVVLQQQIAVPRFQFQGAHLYQRHQHLRTRLQRHFQEPDPPESANLLMLEYLELLLHARHRQPIKHEPSSDALDLPMLRAQLNIAFPEGWTALVYAICADQLLLVTLDEDGAALQRIPLDRYLRQLLERAVTPAFRRLLYLDVMRAHDPARQPWAELEALGRCLLPTAVRATLRPERRLLIMPTGDLHRLAWAALRVDGAWLCERCIPQLIPSLALWPLLQQLRPPGLESLLIGCSQFSDRAPELPGIAAELELVAALRPGPHVRRVDSEATTTALLALAEVGALRRYGLIHVASHAQLVNGRGLLAHIKLWDADLLLDEVARLGLEGTLVVLSTCDGAAGELLAGDEVLSLGRALLAAGARDVVASFWPTYDAPLHELMRHFYTALALGDDAALALVRAQRVLACGYQPGSGAMDATSPLLWGGFTILGAGTRPELSGGV